MKVAGAASALVFLVAITAIRLSDKPLFARKGDSEKMAKSFEAKVKEALAANKGKYAAPG
jgi:hypothetical protein